MYGIGAHIPTAGRIQGQLDGSGRIGRIDGAFQG